MSTTETTGPILVLIRGLPGGGKTYLTHALVEALGKERVAVLDPDSIDLQSDAFHAFSAQLTEEGVEQKFHPYRWSRTLAFNAMSDHKIILWNQPFTNLEMFNKLVVSLQAYASEHTIKLPVLVVEVEVDPEVAKQRVAQRKAEGGHGPDDDVFARFVDDYKTFAGEGYNTVTVQGEDDVATSVTSVTQALKNL